MPNGRNPSVSALGNVVYHVIAALEWAGNVKWGGALTYEQHDQLVVALNQALVWASDYQHLAASAIVNSLDGDPKGEGSNEGGTD